MSRKQAWWMVVAVLAILIGVGLGLMRQGVWNPLGEHSPWAKESKPLSAENASRALPGDQDTARASAASSSAPAGEELASLRRQVAELKARLAEAQALRDELERVRKELAEARRQAQRRKPSYRVSKPIFFGPGQSSLDAADKKIVRQAAREIKATAGVEVTVEGHADKLPMTPPTKKRYGDNLGLSVVRSLNVARELFRQGVALDRVIVIGYGTTRPLDPSQAPGGKVNSRRAVIRQKIPQP